MTRVIVTVVGALVFVALVVIVGNSVEAPVR